ncbi:MAG: hypothetical protein APF77_20795 [Clostridia bacterium BRH_c25]|nr:MAG: hypothetical protein APF77_20795 [Clostridia bacterium BRH_c25]
MPILLVVIIRSVISFFALLLLIRLIGKQQVAQLTFFDYVVGITIGSIASTLSVQVNENTTATLAGMGVWASLAILLGYLGVHNVWVRKVVEGEATVVIENGKILEEHLRKIRIPLDELISELRTQEVFNISDVEFAMFEPGGKLSIQKKSSKQPVTPEDMKLTTQYNGLPTNLIMDGILLTDALKSLKLSRAWLQHQLNKKNIKDIRDISLAQLDTMGNLFVDLKGDKPYYIISTKK